MLNLRARTRTMSEGLSHVQRLGSTFPAPTALALGGASASASAQMPPGSHSVPLRATADSTWWLGWAAESQVVCSGDLDPAGSMGHSKVLGIPEGNPFFVCFVWRLFSSSVGSALQMAFAAQKESFPCPGIIPEAKACVPFLSQPRGYFWGWLCASSALSAPPGCWKCSGFATGHC